MDRDLRANALYREVEAFYRAALEPGYGAATEVSGPEPSPVASSVAFVGQVLDGLDGRSHGRLYTARADGNGWRMITAGPNDDLEPRWSPDGSRLTFRSDRASAGRFQLYLLEAGGVGEARPLPSVPGVVEHHRWSPDGSSILLVVAGARAEQADALGSGTLTGEVEAPAWLPEVESFDDKEEWRSLWVLDLASEAARLVSPKGLNVWEATWLGNEAVAAVVSDAPGEGAWYRAPLARIEVASGEASILRWSHVQFGYAEGAPDGGTIAVIEALCSDRYVVAGDLLLVDPDSGQARRVPTGAADVSSVRWRGDRLFAMGLAGMTALAFDVDPAAGSAKELWRTDEGSGDFYPGGAPSGDGLAFVTTRSSTRRPSEVLMVEGDQDLVLASTRHAGHDLLASHLGSREQLRWSAPDGLEIEGLLTTPPGNGPFPLILWVHGGPVGVTYDRWPGVLPFLLLSRGYALLHPNPRGSGGRGRDFASRVVGDMGGADGDDLLAGIDAVVARGAADPDRIGIAGGSYGGFMAAWLPTRDPRFKAAVAISPVTDWYSEHFNSSLIEWVGDFLAAVPEEPGGPHYSRSPVFAGDGLRTPTLLTAGLRDRATPPGQAVEHFRALRVRGVQAEVALYPGEGHGVRSFPAAIDLATRIVDWFERFMPGHPRDPG